MLAHCPITCPKRQLPSTLCEIRAKIFNKIDNNNKLIYNNDMLKFSIFIGVIIGFKAVLLLYISMILNWIGIWKLDLSIIITFGLLNGFIDAYVIEKKDKFINKIISCITGFLVIILIMFMLGFTDITLKIYDYICYKKYGISFGYFVPAGGFVIILNIALYSLASILFGFPITVIILKKLRNKNYVIK